MDNKVLTADFVNRLADKGYTKKDSAVIIGDFLDVIYEAIGRGEEVKLTGFGTFSVKKAKSKDYVDVHSGERRTAKPHNKLSFKAGNALKRFVEMAP